MGGQGSALDGQSTDVVQAVKLRMAVGSPSGVKMVMLSWSRTVRKSWRTRGVVWEIGVWPSTPRRGLWAKAVSVRAGG